MRADLQAILYSAVNSGTYPISTGQMLDDKYCVLAFLYLKSMAPNVAFNVPNVVNKAAGMQGVSNDNLIDLQIQGLATFFGFGGLSWPQLLATARSNIDGQGVSSGGLGKWLFMRDDYQDLINYSLLTNAKILNDAS